MKKNLSDWASIAEIVGSVAIVVSLVYVGVEISENTRELRAANRQATSERVQELTLRVADNPTLARMLMDRPDWEGASSVELTQFEYWLIAYLRANEDAYLQYLDGLLPEEAWKSREALTIGMLRRARPGWWEEVQNSWDPRFVQWVNQKRAGE